MSKKMSLIWPLCKEFTKISKYFWLKCFDNHNHKPNFQYSIAIISGMLWTLHSHNGLQWTIISQNNFQYSSEALMSILLFNIFHQVIYYIFHHTVRIMKQIIYITKDHFQFDLYYNRGYIYILINTVVFNNKH